MIYDIIWLDDARRELRAMGARLGEESRWELARLAARIDDRLSISPYTQGESRPPHHDVRILFELPLSVLYRIERFQGSVVVLHVRYIGKRSRQ